MHHVDHVSLELFSATRKMKMKLKEGEKERWCGVGVGSWLDHVFEFVPGFGMSGDQEKQPTSFRMEDMSRKFQHCLERVAFENTEIHAKHATFKSGCLLTGAYGVQDGNGNGRGRGKVRYFLECGLWGGLRPPTCQTRCSRLSRRVVC